MVFHCCEKLCIVLYLGKATFSVRDCSGVSYAIYFICSVSTAFHHRAGMLHRSYFYVKIRGSNEPSYLSTTQKKARTS
ncbi:hypothetical protein HanOQP8_Chr05g0181311 [Helianthus annuus]|nr:hypothetical protein HanOQP8_Chr05g0181311 [Helianthus annuus]